MNFSSRLAPLGLAIASSLALGSVRAATITVDTLNDNLNDSECSLRAALASVNAQQALYGCNAPDGAEDQIVFGSLSGTIALNGEQLQILEPVSISGPGADLLEISGQELSRVLLVQADSVISGVTVANGDPGPSTYEYASPGGGIYLNEEYASLTLEDCRLSGNSGSHGGGLAVSAGLATVSRCEITGNSATDMGGGAWVDSSFAERSGSYMTREYGYQAYARLDLVESVVSDNHSDQIGGGLAGGRKVAGILGFYSTVPAPPGVEPVANLPQPSLLLSQTVVSGNTSHYGGGIGVRGPTPVRHWPEFPAIRNRVDILDASVIADNQDNGFGGGIGSLRSDLLIQDSLVENNTNESSGGGGVFFLGIYSEDSLARGLALEPQLVIQSSEISGNSAAEQSPPMYHQLATGGLYVTGATHTLEDVLVTQNNGLHSGGILFDRRTVGSMTRSQVTGNTGQTGGVLMHFWANSDISLSRIEDNHGTYAGGLSCNLGSHCQVRYSSLTGNSGEVGGAGTDIQPVVLDPDLPLPDRPEEPQLTILSSTVSSNAGARVGGIDADWLTLRFATVANNVQESAASQHGSAASEPERPFAAGLLAEGSTSLVDHSIVADNHSAAGNPDAYVLGTALPVSFSVIGAVDAASVDALESFLQTSARLGPLSSNDSEWNLSHLLLPTSPAIAAGDPDIQDPPPFDQRGPGFARILDGHINIGAVEGVGEGAPGQPDAVSVPFMSRIATGLLAGGFLLLAWLGLRRAGA